jgi:hypothetical protein
MSTGNPPWLTVSDGLHSRVQEFILSGSQSREEFEQLALQIAKYQAEFIPGYARLVQAHNSRLDCLDALPAVPVEAFRLTRIAAHPQSVDAVRYVTSGTTSDQRGTHFMRRTDTYRTSAVTWGRHALLPSGSVQAAVVAMVPAESAETSSLAAMAQMFMHAFDPLAVSDSSTRIVSRWLLNEQGIDIGGLVSHLERARDSKLPLIIVATSFGLVRLLDELGKRRLDIWPRTVVMPTGGFKGKTREISVTELRSRVSTAFGIDPRQFVGEYGMTELSSQLYEGCLPGGTLGVEPGIYLPPPWLDVSAVDPETMRPVEPGDSGVARFVDLANVDSALCVVTQDVIRRRSNGLELLGRLRGAPPRGCSLSTEDWLLSNMDSRGEERRD